MNGTVRKTDKGAIGPKDIPYRVSRARDRAIVLTDDQEDLVEALKAVAGPAVIPECAPVWPTASTSLRTHASFPCH